MSSEGNWKDMFKGVQTDDIGLVQYHLANGVDPNYQHPEFMALALVESIKFNHLAIAEVLLENGADPQLEEYWGKDSALSVAEAKKNQEAITLLKKYM